MDVAPGPVVERTHVVDYRPQLGAILRPMQRGSSDPTMRFVDGAVWRTSATPDGPATQQVTLLPSASAPPRLDSATVRSRCWGPGAGWLTERLPDLIGAHDDPSGFAAATGSAGDHPDTESAAVVTAMRTWHARKGRGWRVPRGHNVWESAVAAVLEQKVTGLEAKRAWAGLARMHGIPAPGPAPASMRVFPLPDAIRRVPTWTWRRLGVDRSRSDTIMRLAQVPHVLRRLPDLDPAEARRRLTSIAGVGLWTYAEIAQRALGDADAVSVGDFHLAGDVVYALTGRMDGDDDAMLRVLAPFAGHRYRAVRMIELAGIHKPRRGPRMAIPAHRYG